MKNTKYYWLNEEFSIEHDLKETTPAKQPQTENDFVVCVYEVYGKMVSIVYKKGISIQWSYCGDNISSLPEAFKTYLLLLGVGK